MRSRKEALVLYVKFNKKGQNMMIGVFLHIDNDIHSKTDPLVTAKSIGEFKVSQYICLDLEKETIKQENYCSGIA